MKWIAEHRIQFRISRMAEVFDVSVSGIRSQIKRGPSARVQENQRLLSLIEQEHIQSRKQSRLAIFKYIEGFYNRQRLHSGLSQPRAIRVKQCLLTHAPLFREKVT